MDNSRRLVNYSVTSDESDRFVEEDVPDSETTNWIAGIKKYIYYFERNNDKTKRRCINAISPNYAVTFAHGLNCELKPREGKEKGSEFDVFSFKDGRIVGVEVVFKSEFVDIIIVEAKTDFFFKPPTPVFSDYEVANLMHPRLNQNILAWGLSLDMKENEPAEPCFIPGSVMTTEMDESYRMISNIITWPNDSGGGIFNKECQLVGFISTSYCPEDYEERYNFTRTKFVTSTTVHGALKMVLGINDNKTVRAQSWATV